MREGRQRFVRELRDLEDEVQAMAAAAERLFELSIRALSGRDPTLYSTVVAGDDKVDAYYNKRYVVAPKSIADFS